MRLKLEPVPDVYEYDALTRLWFWVFVQRVYAELEPDEYGDNWHIHKLCEVADCIRTRPNSRYTIALPPRSLKSIIFSVALTAWLLGHDPALEIICVSYGSELAEELSEKCHKVMLSPWYRRLFPRTVLVRQTSHHLVTSAGGKRYSTSIGGTMTGMGADVIIIDDPMKPGEAMSDAERTRINAWARHTPFTRFNDKRDTRCVIVQQRLHEDDLIGHLTEIGGFDHIAFPAIAQDDEEIVIREPFGTTRHSRKEGDLLHPEREPLEALEFQLRLMGPENYAAAYLQSPTPPGGLMIKLVWFPRYERGTEPAFVMKWQSWDTASKTGQTNAYSACVTFGIDDQGRIYVLDVYQARLEYPELKRKIRELAVLHRVGTVLIEEASSGIQLVQELKRDGFALIVGIKPKGPKDLRIRSQTAMMEAGKVYLPAEAHWLKAYTDALERAPGGRFKDQVDATSQGLEWIALNSGPAQWLANFDLLYGSSASARDPWEDPANQTVSFDHPNASLEFKVSTGRMVKRSVDGLYHVTPAEWCGAQYNQGVILVHHPDQPSGA